MANPQYAPFGTNRTRLDRRFDPEWVPAVNKNNYDVFKPTRKKKWTPEALQLEALKYATRLAFQKGSKSAYSQAQKHGQIDSICRHMPKRQKDLTISELKEDALQYADLKSYYTNSRYYKEAARRGVREEICQHMTRKWDYKWSHK